MNSLLANVVTRVTLVWFFQHVLILIKVILSVLIPDEPEWIRKKREHIDYMSMEALKQQVQNLFLVDGLSQVAQGLIKSNSICGGGRVTTKTLPYFFGL